MRRLLSGLLLATALDAFPASAFASSALQVETEGGTVRLVTSGLASAEGELRGALEIDLKPGWKTYWIDPGSGGIPPSIGIEGSVNVGGVDIRFPAPGWHDDGYGAWAGYDHPVALPVIFQVKKPERFSVIEADLFLGICQSICIPVQARMTLEPGSDPDNAADRALVDAAFASLPAGPSEDFAASSMRIDANEIVVAVRLPEGVREASLFLAGAHGWSFGRPVMASAQDGEMEFRAPVLVSGTGAQPEVHYTLATPKGAVSGTLPATQ